MPLRNTWLRVALISVCMTLTSCATLNGMFDADKAVSEEPAGSPPAAAAPRPNEPAAQAPEVNETAASAARTPKIDLGTGTFINQRPISSAPLTVTNGGDIVLSFANANVRDVARVVMSEVLNLNYAVHPQVDGNITLQTSRPLPREAVLPAFENVLQLIGAAVVPTDSVYNIVPVQEAPRQAQRVRIGAERLPRGSQYAIQIVPLEFVAAREMQKILEPVVAQGSIVRVDATRNLLILAGPGREMQTWLSLIDTFDVDWLAGMSFGLFPLTYADASAVISDLENIIAAAQDAPLEGVLRFVALERLNAVLVISPQPTYIARAEKWIRQLDENTDQAGRRLFVYYVQNGNAAELAQVLGDIFQASSETRTREERPSVAPSLRPVVVRSPSATSSAAPPQPQGETATQSAAAPAAARQAASARDVAASAESAGTSLVFQGEQEVRIISDEANNALVVLATPSDFRMVEAALNKLDIPPLQVLIEATIAEVELNDTLRYGLQWFFKQGDSSFTLSEFETGTADSIFPGFSYVLNASDIRVVLNALDTVTDLNVVSSPQLMVLDNRTARLQVGDQVPIVTQQARSVDDSTAPVVNAVEQRDTGVILSVTPRVNAGGLVIMDIEQEVSDVIKTTTSTIDSPTIRTRKIASSIAVQSGETVALGGMIRDRTVDTSAGIPLLHRIPVLGSLFGRTENSVIRTELLVLLTPRVAGSQGDARAITEELRRRVRDLDPLIDRINRIRPQAAPLKPQKSSLDAPAIPARAHLLASTPEPAPTAKPAAVPASAASASVATLETGWKIQLASLDSQARAETAVSVYQRKNPDLLAELDLQVQQADLSRGTVYRVRAGPLPDRAAAARLCDALQSRRQDCLVVAP